MVFGSRAERCQPYRTTSSPPEVASDAGLRLWRPEVCPTYLAILAARYRRLRTGEFVYRSLSVSLTSSPPEAASDPEPPGLRRVLQAVVVPCLVIHAVAPPVTLWATPTTARGMSAYVKSQSCALGAYEGVA